MAFTSVSITHAFTNPDQTAASGKVSFQLTKRISNAGHTVVPGEVVATLDGTGTITALLYANNDPATIPADSEWEVTFRILGASQETFSIVVPTGGGTVDLATLLPQNTTGG